MQINNIDITWKDLFQPIPGLRTYRHNQICIEREVIPIIFIPGIMGSRLVRASDKAKLWDPDDPKFMLNKYGSLKDAARKRKALLVGKKFNPDYAQVANLDEKHNRKISSETDKNRVRRGWGGVMWGSYGDLLITLQEHRWPEPISHCFELPVHAFGYNWCASNYVSGRALSKEIDRIIGCYRDGPEGQVGGPYPRICNSVILVTHSMGGLVARSACMLHGAQEKVLGVVHGVQPATGSPAAYWRMKAGFERPRGGPTRTWWDWLRNPKKMAKHKILGTVSAIILGTDGEEVTSLLGNMPGGLELLPTTDYADNAGNIPWLRYPGIKADLILPRQDPYEEIYKRRDTVYRMVNPEWLDPKGKENAIPEQKTAWHLYEGYLGEAKQFHSQLGLDYHPETYQFLGTDLDSPDKVVFTRKPHISHQPHVHYDPPFFNKGTYATYVDVNDRHLPDSEGAAHIVMMGMPDGKGDGTVPESSGSALKVEETRVKKIGQDDADWFCLGHQDIYSTTAAQRFVFDSIGSLIFGVIDKECGTCYGETTHEST